jgi:hypothetical protein
MVQTVVLCANGEFKTAKIADVSPAGISKATRKVKQPAVLGTYKFGGVTLTLWGWSEGRAGTENKHELPPPHDKGLFFSDIYIASSAGDYTVAAWKEFYDAAFKGFEDLGDEDTDSESSGSAADEEDDEINGDADEEDGAEGSDDDEVDGEDEGDGDGEGGDDGSAAGSEDDDEEEEDGDDDCYDSDEGGGGGKRRAPRRRAAADPEYRRMEMGLRSKIKLPAQVGRRAPRWQTAAQLEPEP